MKTKIQRAIDSLIKKATSKFEENNVYYEIYPGFDGRTIVVEINRGDWKHDHGFVDYIMKSIGGVKVDEEITEEDGSDNYSSIHYFTPKQFVL